MRRRKCRRSWKGRRRQQLCQGGGRREGEEQQEEEVEQKAMMSGNGNAEESESWRKNRKIKRKKKNEKEQEEEKCQKKEDEEWRKQGYLWRVCDMRKRGTSQMCVRVCVSVRSRARGASLAPPAQCMQTKDEGPEFRVLYRTLLDRLFVRIKN